MIQRLLKLFKPNGFEGDFYGWLTNQVSHVAFSCSVVFMFSMFNPVGWVSLAVFSASWAAWEIRHLKQTGNFKDFYQDLFFELSGIVIFIFPKYLIFVYLVFVISIIKFLKPN